jgi:hypothetical protein
MNSRFPSSAHPEVGSKPHGKVEHVARPHIGVRTDASLEDVDIDIIADATPDDDLDIDTWLEENEKNDWGKTTGSENQTEDKPGDLKLEDSAKKAQSSSTSVVETLQKAQLSTIDNQKDRGDHLRDAEDVGKVTPPNLITCGGNLHKGPEANLIDQLEGSNRQTEQELSEYYTEEEQLEGETLIEHEPESTKLETANELAPKSANKDLIGSLEMLFEDDVFRQELQGLMTAGNATISRSFTQQGFAVHVAIGVQDVNHESYGVELGAISEWDKKLAADMPAVTSEDHVEFTWLLIEKQAEAFEKGEFTLAKEYSRLLCRISALYKEAVRKEEEGQHSKPVPQSHDQKKQAGEKKEPMIPQRSVETSSTSKSNAASREQKTVGKDERMTLEHKRDMETKTGQLSTWEKQLVASSEQINDEVKADTTPPKTRDTSRELPPKLKVEPTVKDQIEEDVVDYGDDDLEDGEGSAKIKIGDGHAEPVKDSKKVFESVETNTKELAKVDNTVNEPPTTKSDNLKDMVSKEREATQDKSKKSPSLRDAPPLESLENKHDICRFDAKCTNKNCRRVHPSRDADLPDPEKWTQGNGERCKFDSIGCRNQRCGYAHENPFVTAAAPKTPTTPTSITNESRKEVKCPWINKPQGCRFGDKCNFDHSHKGEICPNLDTAEGCIDGAWKCVYVYLQDSEHAQPAAAHRSRKPSGTPGSTIGKAGTRYPNILCRNIQIGNSCHMGDNCFWSHDLELAASGQSRSPSPAPTPTRSFTSTGPGSLSGSVRSPSLAAEAASPPPNAPTGPTAASRAPRSPYVPPQQRDSSNTAGATPTGPKADQQQGQNQGRGIKRKSREYDDDVLEEQGTVMDETEAQPRRSNRLNPGVKRNRRDDEEDEDVANQPKTQRSRTESAPRSLVDRITSGNSQQASLGNDTLEGAPRGPSGNSSKGRGSGRGGNRGGRGGNNSDRGRGGRGGSRGGRARRGQHGKNGGGGRDGGADGGEGFQIKGTANR